MLQAGVAQVCVTPPLSVELAGYGPLLHRRSCSVHDDLYAAALVLGDDRMRVAIVTADIIAFDAIVVRHIRQLASEATGIPADHILISCTRSHTAPTARWLRHWGERDGQYVAMLERQIVGAVAAANQGRQEARLGWGAGNHPDLAWNREDRRRPATAEKGPVDASVQVLRVDATASGHPLALLVNYACHPVMLGPNTAISADYPGALRRHVTTTFPAAVVLFANGTCGDIDPATNRDVWGKATFDDVDRAGAALAREVIRVAGDISLRATAPLQVEQAWVELPYLALTAAEVEQELARREATMQQPSPGLAGARAVGQRRFWLDWAQDVVEALTAGSVPAQERIEIQAVSIGEIALLAIPAEVFTEIGVTIKTRSPYTQLFIITYANGDAGYITSEQDFALRGYASSMAFAIHGCFQFQDDVGRRLTEAATALLQKREV